MNRRKKKLSEPLEFDKNFKHDGPLLIVHLPAFNQTVAEASTGGGKYEATQSGPNTVDKSV